MKALGSALLLALTLGAQDPPAAIRGVVRSDSGRPLDEARLLFVPDTGIGLRWLPDPPLEAPPGRAQSDERGRFRISPSAASGCLIVRHDGLGTVLPSVTAGEILPIALQPLGEARFQDGATFEAALLLLRPPGDAIQLPAHRGDTLRLPSGEYLMLARRPDGHTSEHRLRIGAGDRLSIAVPTQLGATLSGLEPGVTCSLQRWPGFQFVDRLPALVGPARLRISLRSDQGAMAVEEQWVEAGQQELLVAPPDPRWTKVRVVDEQGLCPPRTVLYSISATPAGGATIRAADHQPRNGLFAARVDRPAFAVDFGLVAIAPGHAPSYLAIPDDGAIPALLLRPEQLRSFRLLDWEGRPLAGATAHVRIPEAPLLSRVLTSDALGLVRIPLAPSGELSLRIDAAAHTPLDTSLPTSTDQTAEFTLIRGHGLQGRVVDVAGHGLVAVTVLLRNTADDDAVPRVILTDTEGRFRFNGLAKGLYLISARLERDGETWSAQLRAQPGQDEWHLVLRSEDPPIPDKPR